MTLTTALQKNVDANFFSGMQPVKVWNHLDNIFTTMETIVIMPAYYDHQNACIETDNIS